MRLERALSMLVGAFLTYFLPFNPVLSSALVGLAFAFFMPNLALSAYIGSFIGMSAEELLSPALLPIAVVFSAGVFELIWKKLPPLGGKAGFTAFLGVIAVLLLADRMPEQRDPLTEVELLVSLFVLCFIGVLATYKLRKISPGNNVVFAASTTGIFAGLLYYILPELGEVLYAAAFAGMGPETWGRSKKTALVAGALVALTYILTYHLFPGVGGKLGTVAFIGSIVAYFLFGHG